MWEYRTAGERVREIISRIKCVPTHGDAVEQTESLGYQAENRAIRDNEESGRTLHIDEPMGFKKVRVIKTNLHFHFFKEVVYFNQN